MSNATELLKKLKGPKEFFHNYYDIFMKKCLDGNEVSNMEDTSEINNLMSLLQKHNHLMPNIVQKLFELNTSVHFHECNLFIYESFYKDNNDMLLSYTDIESSPELKETYLSSGADIAAFAITTGQNWIEQSNYCDV